MKTVNAIIIQTDKQYLMTEPNLKRRAFLRGRSPKFNKAAIHPPWALPFAAFIDHCERCDACIDACSEGIIVRGDGGFPEVDFTRGECVFCTDCVKACDAGAFQAFQRDEFKEKDAWDLSVEILTSCLSLNAVVCRSCGDHCDTGAISFRLQTGGVSVPMIEEKNCTGCGACLYVCPKDAIAIKVINPVSKAE